MVGQFMLLFRRYIRAIGVACFVSFAVAQIGGCLMLVGVPDSVAMFSHIILMVLVAFTGVVAGSLCSVGLRDWSRHLFTRSG
jgi:hypothetical protein